MARLNCSFTNISNSEADMTSSYDGKGAMVYIVTVIIVYGFAVIGVFIFGFFRKRKIDHFEVDRQAMLFFKDLPRVRNQIEKEKRKENIGRLLSEHKYLTPKPTRHITREGKRSYNTPVSHSLFVPESENNNIRKVQQAVPERLNKGSSIRQDLVPRITLSVLQEGDADVTVDDVFIDGDGI